MMQKRYQKQLQKYAAQQVQEQRLFDRLGNLKLLAFVLVLAALALLIWRGYGAGRLLLLALSVLVLIGLSVQQSRHKKKLRFCHGMVRISQEYLDRIAGDWNRFADTGAEYWDLDHPYAADLDVVGAKSLFQMLNVTHTWHGRRCFSRDLLEPAYGAAEIAARQEAVTELAPKLGFGCRFQYQAAEIEPDAMLPQLITNLQDGKLCLDQLLLQAVVRFLPYLTLPVTLLAGLAFVVFALDWRLPFAALSAALNWRPLWPLFLGLWIVQFVLWLAGMSRTNAYLAAAGRAPLVFGRYAQLFQQIGAEQFQSELLVKIQGALTGSQSSAVRAITELDLIINRASIKSYGIVYYLANIVLLWDYRCARQLGAWKQKYGPQCEDWFWQLGEFESLLSFSGLINVCDNTCLPRIETSQRAIQARQLGHPLLANANRVCNDLNQTGGILIISGSNMSGKTTFLRTLGINLLLARAGSAVCAAQFSCPICTLRTSMRIRDDLNEGISTFYAELKRVKGILDTARERQDLYFLIDEIFRGTNSEDRLFGAAAVIRELSKRAVMGLITTHDLSLCELEQQCANVHNYSFSERYEHDEMIFDYRLHQGKSTSTNAKFLMERIGILNK